MAIEYDDRNLQKLLKELEPKRRTQALKNGFRREATRVRRVAIGNIRNSIRSDKNLEKGVRAVVFKKTAGFKVTVGTKRANKNGKGGAGYHTNRQGLKKPVLMWADIGTKQRKTKGKNGSKSRRTGRMRRYGFMEQTLSSVRGSVTENIKKEVAESILRTSKKYGCK